MGYFSKTELILTYFYTKPNFVLALWKDLVKLNQKQAEILKKETLRWIFEGKKLLAP